ncbi:hypothetical protein BX286_0235 [Streptomyces sp. 3211.6]|uniref:hypothetical protein n=1 Tax=Streptomyces TaxID=1883 RepID=UPI0009A47EFB|nr:MULTISPECIES: hypothetical protein [Streptomyces]RKT02341.1 hypothetical protein BX286_0235 [Streptomyces sp. 3211.6]RPF43658.1 hypothetical protein EDD96_0160 [Streptomyces sp. Ag109_G2-6]
MGAHGVALADPGGKLWMFFRAVNGALLAATHSNNAWSGYHNINTTTPPTMPDEPAAASYNNKLYVMYRR